MRVEAREAFREQKCSGVRFSHALSNCMTDGQLSVEAAPEGLLTEPTPPGLDVLRFRLKGKGSTREVAARWTPALVAGGWTPISDFFLDNYHKLQPKITGPEVLLVLHLMRHKWDATAPFPALKTLAKRLGVSSTSVRNTARSLEAKKYLKRQMRIGSTNRFDLTPLFRALEVLQREPLAEILPTNSTELPPFS